MRELKFRCFDTLSPKMYIGHSLSISANGTFCFLEDNGQWNEYDSDERIKIMQYTGLKDGKGSDIYEGDLITLRGKYLYEVKFEDGKFVCYHVIKEYGRWGDLKRMSDMDFEQYGHEVIGNIYENVELVNAEIDMYAKRNNTTGTTV